MKTVFGKKGRQTPHYLQSILAVQNQKCKDPYEQLTLMDTRPFDYKTFEDDYNEIMFTSADGLKEFTHYIVAYTVSSNGLLDINLILFDSNFNKIGERSLNSFITPDYGKLTETPDIKSASAAKSARNLVALKSGLKLQLVEMDKDE